MLYALLGQITPYIALGVFLVGLVWKIVAWAKTPLPLRVRLTPTPTSTAGNMVVEIALFRSMFRGRKEGWAGAWLFHLSLAFLLVGHLFGIGFGGKQFVMFGVSEEVSKQLSAGFGSGVGILIMFTVAYLLIRRCSIPFMKKISNSADYFILFLLLAIILTGNYMRFFSEVDLIAVKDYVAALLTLHPEALPNNPFFAVHFTLIQILLLYFPFSKLLHTCGIFFTRYLAAANKKGNGETLGVRLDKQGGLGHE